MSTKLSIFELIVIELMNGGFMIYEVYFFTFSEINREYIQNGPGPVISPTEEYTANLLEKKEELVK